MFLGGSPSLSKCTPDTYPYTSAAWSDGLAASQSPYAGLGEYFTQYARGDYRHAPPTSTAGIDYGRDVQVPNFYNTSYIPLVYTPTSDAGTWTYPSMSGERNVALEDAKSLLSVTSSPQGPVPISSPSTTSASTPPSSSSQLQPQSDFSPINNCLYSKDHPRSRIGSARAADHPYWHLTTAHHWTLNLCHIAVQDNTRQFPAVLALFIWWFSMKIGNYQSLLMTDYVTWCHRVEY